MQEHDTGNSGILSAKMVQYILQRNYPFELTRRQWRLLALRHASLVHSQEETTRQQTNIQRLKHAQMLLSQADSVLEDATRAYERFCQRKVEQQNP